jgi:hypothetical protein
MIMPRVFFCTHCGKQTKVKVPRGGDGSMLVPARHTLKGLNLDCPGTHEEAEERQIILTTLKKKKK